MLIYCLIHTMIKFVKVMNSMDHMTQRPMMIKTKNPCYTNS